MIHDLPFHPVNRWKSGAGASGLVTAKTAREAGHEATSWECHGLLDVECLECHGLPGLQWSHHLEPSDITSVNNDINDIIAMTYGRFKHDTVMILVFLFSGIH